jgi:hypothetical protein
MTGSAASGHVAKVAGAASDAPTNRRPPTRLVLVGTGAEISAVPRRLAADARLDWDTLPVLGVAGVGPGRVLAKRGPLSLRIGTIELTVGCLFLGELDAPYILGCPDVFDRLALTIGAGQGKMILTEIN